MHFIILTTIAALLGANSLVHGSIIGPDDRQERLLAAYCQDSSLTAHTYYPTEDDHNMGARLVCDSFYSGALTKDVTKDEKNIATVTLTTYDQKGTVAWVYEMALDDSKVKETVAYDTCVSEFVNVLAEGRMGENYYVPEGMETVLSLRGKREITLQEGTLRFEVRKKRGT